MQNEPGLWRTVWESLKDVARAVVEDLKTGGMHGSVLRAPEAVAHDPAADAETVIATPTTEHPKRVVVQVVTTTGHVLEFAVMPMVAHHLSDGLLRAAAKASQKPQAVA